MQRRLFVSILGLPNKLVGIIPIRLMCGSVGCGISCSESIRSCIPLNELFCTSCTARATGNSRESGSFLGESSEGSDKLCHYIKMIGCQAIDIKVVWGGVAARKVYISYILMSNFDFTGNMSASLSSDKLGVTTTVKEQVENIEGALVHFKSCIDMQKKQQGELQMQLKKLDEKTHRQFNELLREITDRAAQLTDIFRNENQKQSKEFQYMQLQGGILTEQHQKLNQINGELGGRTGSIQGVVGV